MREKDYYGAIKGFCLKWNLPEVWNSDRITGANLIYEVIKVINAMIVEQKATKEMIEEFIRMFDEDLSETVNNILIEWKDSGMLEGIINDALFNQKLDKSVFDDEISRIDGELEDLDEKIKHLKDVVVSVTEYGAVGDGINDDTLAIQNAINENDFVYLPKGRYRITDTITLLNSKTIMGVSLSNRYGDSSSELWYDGVIDDRKTMIQLGGNSVGEDPTLSNSSNNVITNVRLDGGGKIGFGIYGTYFTNESVIDNVFVTNTTEHGIYVAKGWYGRIENITVLHNLGCGISLGMPLRYRDGTSVTWSSYASLELNGISLHNIRAHTNGKHFESIDTIPTLKDGYGIGLGYGTSIILDRFLSENNYGVGVYMLNGFQPVKALQNGYLEKNMRNYSGVENRHHIILDDVGTTQRQTILENIFLHSTGGILHDGNGVTHYIFKNVWSINNYKSLSLSDESLLLNSTFENSGNYHYNVQTQSQKIILRETFNPRYTTIFKFPINFGRCQVWVRRKSSDIPPGLSTLTFTQFNDTTGSISLANVINDEFVMVREITNVKRIGSVGGGSVDGDIEIVVVTFDVGRYGAVS